VGGHVDGMLAENLQRHDLEGALVGGGQHDVRGRPVTVGPQPVRGGHAPPVAGDQAGESVLRRRRGQVVADAALVRQELDRHHGADRVAARVLGAGCAAAVPVEASDRVAATGLQLAAEHITIHHL
jgi:hypothetical protein